MDSAGRLQLGSVPDVSTSEGLVAVVSSPGTPSVLSSVVDSPSNEATLTLVTDDDSNHHILVCRGAVLRGTTEADRTAMTTCFGIARAVVLDGITVGDVQAGLDNTRHARTLTALFRARLLVDTTESTTQRMVFLVVEGGSVSEEEEQDLQSQVEELYAAVALEKEEASAFQDAYKLHVVSTTSAEDSSKV